MIAFTREPSGRRASTIGEIRRRGGRRRDDSLNRADYRAVVGENNGRAGQLSVLLDEDFVVTIDHDFRHGGVLNQFFQRSQSDNFVEHAFLQRIERNVRRAETGIVIQDLVESDADRVAQFVFFHARDVQAPQIERGDHFHVSLLAQLNAERTVDRCDRQYAGYRFPGGRGLAAERDIGCGLG